MEKIKNLLQQVSIIQRKYDEIAKITGENFNIFSVMRAESDEVRTHSRIIAEFLNPKGIHNQGSIFLKLFFEEIKILETIKNDFDYDNAQVLVEEHIGTIDKDYSEGGFIDIVIKDSKNQVVIENKIYAGDQKGQLLRYKKYYPNCKLVYLTLEGKVPSEYSYKIGNGQELNLEDLILVSYRNEVKNWIEKCLEKTHSLPIIRETLVQYLHLIKKLTNQTTNNKMSKDIVERMEKDIQASFEVANNLYELKKKIYYDFIESLKNSDELKFDNCENIKYYGVDAVLENNKRISILFGKNNEKDDFALDVSIGFLISNNVSDEIKDKYRKNGFTVTDWVYKRFSTYNYNSNNWTNNIVFWEDIQKGTQSLFYKDIKKIIKEIIDIENTSN